MPQNLEKARCLLGVAGVVFFEVRADATASVDDIAAEMLGHGCDVTVDREEGLVKVFQHPEFAFSRMIPKLIRSSGLSRR
jgi:hypothetical protein